MGERLAGIKPLERSCRRWQLYVCSWIYEELCTSACPRGFETHVEAVSPPDTVPSVADLPTRDTIIGDTGRPHTGYARLDGAVIHEFQGYFAGCASV